MKPSVKDLNIKAIVESKLYQDVSFIITDQFEEIRYTKDYLKTHLGLKKYSELLVYCII